MKINWQNGIYDGEVNNDLPHGKGVLTLENGIKKGYFENGVLRRGTEYIGDTFYYGSYDQNGERDGWGYVYKEYGDSWQGQWSHGEKIPNDDSEKIPNYIIIGAYSKYLDLVYYSDDKFKGKEMKPKSYPYYTEVDEYPLPEFSRMFGLKLVALVVKANNRYDYSKRNHSEITIFTDKDSGPIYDEALICQIDENGNYAPLDPKSTENIADMINIIYLENFPRYAENTNQNLDYNYLDLGYGIFKGVTDGSKPAGNGTVLFDIDDENERICYFGSVTESGLTGYSNLTFKSGYYKGSMKEGCYHGKGELSNNDGIFDGEWNSGAFEGKDNRIRSFNDRNYRGLFIGGKIVYGTCEYISENNEYTGPFEDFEPHGKGTLNKIINSYSKDKLWEGYFNHGKKVAGIGKTSNALEIFDPFTSRGWDFESTEKEDISAVLGSDDIVITQNAESEKLSKIVDTKLAFVYSTDKKLAPNSVASKLFGIENPTGGLLIMGYNGTSLTSLSSRCYDKLEITVTELISDLKSNEPKLDNGGELQLFRKFNSHFVETACTHDDYPTKGYDEDTTQYRYLVDLCGEKYVLELKKVFEDPYNAYHKVTTCSAWYYMRAHKLPSSLSSDEDIIKYTEAQDRWSAEARRTFDGESKDYTPEFCASLWNSLTLELINLKTITIE